MTLEELAYISQIFSGVAIFASLVFLGLQMRAQTREARYGTMNQILTDFDQILGALSNDPVAARDHFAGQMGGLEAVPLDRRAAHIFIVARMLRLYDRAYIQRAAGRLGDDAWQSIHRGLGPTMSGKSSREYWLARKAAFSPAFITFVDKEMERAQPIPFSQLFPAVIAAPVQPSSSETQSAQP